MRGEVEESISVPRAGTCFRVFPRFRARFASGEGECEVLSELQR